VRAPGKGSLSHALLSALAAGDDERTRQLFRELLGASDSGDFTSDALPPSIRTRKAFAQICSSGLIAGAVQDGPRGPWRCSRDAWHAARSRRPATTLRLVRDELTIEELADAAIAIRGAR
jgi:hypothetical protein